MLFVEKTFQKQKQAFALQTLREADVLYRYNVLTAKLEICNEKLLLRLPNDCSRWYLISVPLYAIKSIYILEVGASIQ
jgi:hypothetical protein